MKKHPILITVILGCIALTCTVGTVYSQVLTLNNGSTLTITGGVLDVNCHDILVRDGASLLLQSGEIQDKRMLTVVPGGTFTNISGTIQKCVGYTFYILRPPGGKPFLVPLPKNWSSD